MNHKSGYNNDDSLSSEPEEQLSGQIVSILDRFREIPEDEIKKFLDDVYTSLKQHIKGYSRKGNRKNSVYTPYTLIDKICSSASDTLARSDTQAMDKILKCENDFCRTIIDPETFLAKLEEPKYRFHQECLCNVKLLIPKESNVVKILPYLLICYSENFRQNKQDPFEYYEVNQSGNAQTKRTAILSCPSWLDIFPEYNECFDAKELSICGNTNLNRNIGQLANYLSRISDSVHLMRYSLLLSQKGLNPVILHISASRKEVKTEFDYCLEELRDWESYRRFATFCDACHKYESLHGLPHFNLTLSMALFASCWKKDIKDSKNGKDAEDSRYDGNIEIDYPEPLTWQDVENDRLRDEIITVIKCRNEIDKESCDIHDIIWRKKLWLIRSYTTESDGFCI